MFGIIILVVILGVVGIGIFYFMKNSKANSNISKCNNTVGNRTFNDDRLLKNLKSEVSDKTVDDIINNINRSKNTLLEEALNSNNFDEDILRKIKRTKNN